VARPSPQTDRLITLVDLLTARPHEGLTLSEIARRLGVTPATCHPMLATLTQAGWLIRHPTRRTYRLGPAIVAAGHSAAAGFPALDFAHPVMAEVQRDLGLAVLALAPSDGHATLVDLVRDPGVPGPAIRIGDQTPLHPPFGVPYVAWADEADVERWLALAPPTADVREHYRQVLKATRERGFSVDLATAPEARVHAALTRLERLKDDTGPEPDTRLRAVLEALAGELAAEHEFLPVALHRSRRYRVSSISAPIFDGDGAVTLLLALRGFADALPGRDIQAVGERLALATDGITATTGGHRPT
jgi:DNA-binding IclR family transcriptional regulator